METSVLTMHRFMRLIKSSVVAGIFLLTAFPVLCLAYGGILTDDSYVSSKTPAKNFGKATDILISPLESSYLNFKITEPTGYTGANIAKAVLKVFISEIKSSGNLTVNQIDNIGWTEGTIKYNSTLPADIGSTQFVAVAATQKMQWLEVDITSLLQNRIDSGNHNFGLALKSDFGLSLKLNSKENIKTSHDPSLEIVWDSNGAINHSGPTGSIKGSLAPMCANSAIVYVPGRSIVAYTGPDKSFQLDQIPPGTYDVTIETRTAAPTTKTLSNVTVSSNTLTDTGATEVTDITSDPANCGACNVICNSLNATSFCNSGICSIGSCNSGFANCDNNSANGCEINTANNVNNCGMCGNVSDDGNQCTLDACTNGASTHTNSVSGTTCNQNGGTQCNGAGQCI